MDDNDFRKIAIYSRKSKYTGKGESINNQIEICKKTLECRFSGVDLINDVIIYEDEGFTGANTRRPGFQRLLSDIKSNKIKCVICYRLDRISRNVSDFSMFKNTFDSYNVTFISISENFDTSTPMGNAMMMISSVFAQLERDTMAERIRDNMLELAKTGRWLGGVSPTGFRSSEIKFVNIDGKRKKLFKLVPINSEINIVKIIFDKYLELKSQTALEYYLLENNIRTKNNKFFSRWSIVNILTNPVYVINDIDVFNYFHDSNIRIYADKSDFDSKHSLMVYNKTKKVSDPNRLIKRDMDQWIVAIGKHKGIISGKKWVLVQAMLKKNRDKKYRRPKENEALLAGVLKCSSCGSFMRPKLKSVGVVDEFNKRRFDYICTLKDKSHKKMCCSLNINGNVFDGIVIDRIQKLLYSIDIDSLELMQLSCGFFDDDSTNELLLLEQEYAKNIKDIDSLLDKIKYIDNELLGDIQNEIKRLRNVNSNIDLQIKNIRKKTFDILDDNDMVNVSFKVLNNYFDIFYDFDILKKRELIKSVMPFLYSDGLNLEIGF